MALTVDINPWGKVLDYRSNDFVGEVARSAYLEEGRLNLEDVRQGEIDVQVGRFRFRLQVDEVLGGNQFNVWKNLGLFPSVDVQAHFGFGSEEAVARRVLYLRDLPKITLTKPNTNGLLLFANAPRDRDFILSSAPHGEGSAPYWDALQAYLDGPGKGAFYLNPGSQQLNGSIPGEVIKRLQGRIKVLQTNEEEAAKLARSYGRLGATERDLPEIFGAHLTVVTRGVQGLRLYAEGRASFEMPIPSDEEARRILGNRFLEKGDDVGCGDATFTGFVAATDTIPNVDPEQAANLAMELGSTQFHHRGSNLAAFYTAA